MGLLRRAQRLTSDKAIRINLKENSTGTRGTVVRVRDAINIYSSAKSTAAWLEFVSCVIAFNIRFHVSR